MKQVAKLIIIDNDNKHLLMHRSDHPAFGTDPDLPGGTLEDGEQPLATMIREVQEEAGIEIEDTEAVLLYQGSEYSTNGTEYSLYRVTLDGRPDVTISWEHSSYEWIDRDQFLEKSKDAKDTYMHMVYAVLSKV